MSTPDLTNYRSLLESVSTALAEGRLRAEQAVEHERLATYHEVGRLIHEHLLAEGRDPKDLRINKLDK